MLNFNGFDNLIPYFSFAKKALNREDIFFVGGIIRDILLNLNLDDFSDVDITLAGDPLKVYENLDKNSGSIFKTDKFGTITIVDKTQNCQFEITPFREEGNYSDARHPDELSWTDSLISDSIRRDFTINALYYTLFSNLELKEKNLKFDKKQIFKINSNFDKNTFTKVLRRFGYVLVDVEDSNPVLIIQDHNLIDLLVKNKISFDYNSDLFHVIIDPQNGIQDMLNQKIRAVGNPDDRIKEDALRIIRGIRFVSVLNQKEHINLDFDSKTWLAMKKYYFLLSNVAKERVIQEMKKVFKNGNAFGFVALMDELNILKFYFPSLYNCKNNNQPTRYHPFDTYSHTILCLYHLQQINSNYLVKFGMLYHDVGKPDQYYWASIKKDEESAQELYKLPINHPIIGEKLTIDDFKKLGFSKKEVGEIAFYVRYHMFPGELMNMGENKRKKEIKKFISDYGLDRLLNLCDVTIGDRLGQYNPLQHSDIDGVNNLKEEIKSIYEESGRITLKSLEVNGNDIIKIIGESGPLVGQILNKLLEFVIEDEKRNDKKVLLEKAKQIYNTINCS